MSQEAVCPPPPPPPPPPPLSPPTELSWRMLPSGAKPTMEDRHVIIPSYDPVGAAGQRLQDGVPRNFLAVYDGHNGQRAAEAASHRCPLARLLLPSFTDLVHSLLEKQQSMHS